jgi:hypothetical protein
MLVELAAANAAFSVIKEAVQNGGDLMAAGQKLFDFFDNKNAIQKKASSGNDMEAFAALEQLKNSEAELKRMMIYHGRAGLWDDWLNFKKKPNTDVNPRSEPLPVRRLRVLPRHG